MAAEKFLKLNSSGIPEITSGAQTSAGASSAGRVICANESGDIDESWLPSGIGADLRQVTWAEDVSYGSLINVYLDSATWKGRKADGGTNKYRADGFATATGTSGNTGYVQFGGIITGQTGIVAGNLFLSQATAGTWVQTVPSSTGISQVIGLGISDDSYYFSSRQEYVISA